jgi:hypothetical protein
MAAAGSGLIPANSGQLARTPGGGSGGGVQARSKLEGGGAEKKLTARQRGSPFVKVDGVVGKPMRGGGPV